MNNNNLRAAGLEQSLPASLGCIFYGISLTWDNDRETERVKQKLREMHILQCEMYGKQSSPVYTIQPVVKLYRVNGVSETSADTCWQTVNQCLTEGMG